MKQRSWLAILLSFAGPCRGKLVLSVICAIISVVGGFVPYLGVYEILRLFIHQSASGTELLRWAGVCLAGYTVKVAFYAFSTMLAHVSAYTILEGLRRQVAHKLMHAPLGSVLSKPVGSLKSTIVDRIEDIEPPLAHMIPELSSNVLLPIVVVIALFAMDWRMGLASLATIPAALIPMAASLRTYNEKYAAYMAANAQVNSIIVEYVEGIEVVKAFNQSGASYEKLVPLHLEVHEPVPVYPAYHAAGHPASWDRPVSDRRPGPGPAGSVLDAGAGYRVPAGAGCSLSQFHEEHGICRPGHSASAGSGGAARGVRARPPLRQRYHFAGCVLLV